MSARNRRFLDLLLVVLLLAGVGLVGPQATALPVAATPVLAAGGMSDPAGGLDQRLVFVRLPADHPMTREQARSDGMRRADYGDGCQIWRLEATGEARRLTSGFAAACDPDVSFDGAHILFAGKRTPDDSWNIYEMAVDGGEVRQVTHDAGNCRSPGYLATFYTIVSTEPWFQLMFVSDMAGERNEYGEPGSESLYSCRIDGSSIRRLTINPSDDLDPYLMQDGRILLSSWRRMDLRNGYQGLIELFGVNSDGTDYALFSSNRNARVRHMACEVGNTWADEGLVVFVETDGMGWDGGGRLACIAERTPFGAERPLGSVSDVLYHSPSPLPDGTLVVARRPADGSKPYGLWRLDPRSGEESVILDDQRFHDFHARSLASRSQPDGRSSSVNEEIKTGILYCLDSATVDPRLQPFVKPGLARRLRVIEGMPVPDSIDRSLPADWRHPLAGNGSSRENLAGLLPRRILGEIPIEDDGSFQVEVPPNIPIELQTLDENGVALFDCGWIWVKNRDWRGCIGCHEDPLRVPENVYVDAVQKPATKLLAAADERPAVVFRRDVMPIVEARCTACHDGGAAPPDLRGDPDGPFNRAYLGLMSANAETPGHDVARRGRWIHPGRARTSPLVWMLLGRNTARPWDAEYDPDAKIEQHPPAGGSGHVEPLRSDEIATILTWIDLGAAWDQAGGEGDQERGSIQPPQGDAGKPLQAPVEGDRR